jgi:tetratricopeptide (TPR) repeat protein
MSRNKTWVRRAVLLIGSICVVANLFLLAYQMPAIRDRLSWRIELAAGYVRGWFNPHAPSVATPDPRAATSANATLLAMSATPGAAVAVIELSGLRTTLSPLSFPIPTPTKTLLPPQKTLPYSGHEWQKWNNCGPDSLAMQLKFWGWKGTQDQTAAYLKPNSNDKNVSLFEMAEFADDQAGLAAWVRAGGTLDDLRTLIAAGYPVIIERGFELTELNSGWMGHYTLLTGYDDDRRTFLSQDAYRGPNFIWTYADVESSWQAFNYFYLVVFPKDQESALQLLLGAQADPIMNIRSALGTALIETQSQQDQALAYAWFNAGTNYVALGQMDLAADAFDQARTQGLPWRFLWYQFGPFRAYAEVQRYDDVITLTEAILHDTDHVEEAWYWRGVARMAQGDRAGAISDWHMALQEHAGYGPAIEQLQAVGESTS